MEARNGHSTKTTKAETRHEATQLKQEPSLDLRVLRSSAGTATRASWQLRPLLRKSRLPLLRNVTLDYCCLISFCPGACRSSTLFLRLSAIYRPDRPHSACCMRKLFCNLRAFKTAFGHATLIQVLLTRTFNVPRLRTFKACR